MKFQRMLFFVLIMVTSTPVSTFAISRVICTAAISDAHFEFRKQQYIAAFEMLYSLGIHDFYVVEALKKNGPTFLEDYSKNVFYATVNNPNLRNHGINEAKTLLEACEYFNFGPEDMIIKLTGRHRVSSDLFFKTIENNPGADAFVKVNEDGNVFTVGFAMKYKYLKEMYENIDYHYINQHMIPIEYRVGDYIKRKKREGNFSVIYLQKLDMIANIFGSTTAPGAPAQTLVL